VRDILITIALNTRLIARTVVLARPSLADPALPEDPRRRRRRGVHDGGLKPLSRS